MLTFFKIPLVEVEEQIQQLKSDSTLGSLALSLLNNEIFLSYFKLGFADIRSVETVTQIKAIKKLSVYTNPKVFHLVQKGILLFTDLDKLTDTSFNEIIKQQNFDAILNNSKKIVDFLPALNQTLTF
jgi:hypothetical protein